MIQELQPHLNNHVIALLGILAPFRDLLMQIFGDREINLETKSIYLNLFDKMGYQKQIMLDISLPYIQEIGKNSMNLTQGYVMTNTQEFWS